MTRSGRYLHNVRQKSSEAKRDVHFRSSTCEVRLQQPRPDAVQDERLRQNVRQLTAFQLSNGQNCQFIALAGVCLSDFFERFGATCVRSAFFAANPTPVSAAVFARPGRERQLLLGILNR